MTQSDAIRKQLDALAADIQKQINTQNTYRQTGSEALRNTYGELVGNLQTNLGDITDTVDRGRSQIGSDYGAASQNIGLAEQDLRSMLGSDINNFNSPLQEIQRITAQNQASKADSLASNQLLGTGYLTQGRQAIADAQREGASRQSDLTSQIGADIGEIQRVGTKERASLEAELARVLAEERERELQRQLEREKMAQEQAYRNQQLSIERQRLAGENSARAAASQRFKGREGLMQWASQNGIDQGSINAILKSVDMANATGDPAKAYQYLQTQIARSGRGNIGKGPGRGGGLFYGTENRGRFSNQVPRSGGSLSSQLLNTGLDIYYGNYASYE